MAEEFLLLENSGLMAGGTLTETGVSEDPPTIEKIGKLSQIEYLYSII